MLDVVGAQATSLSQLAVRRSLIAYRLLRIAYCQPSTAYCLYRRIAMRLY